MEKIKYLDMENATLKLQLDTIAEYEQFFKQHFENFKQLFKRGIKSVSIS